MKKLMNKKGFTLMEMLIVIAIIVILVAIAVPSFTSSLEKANKTTDAANFRSAELAARVLAMDDTSYGEKYYYDLNKGDLVNVKNEDKDIDGSKGKCSTHSSVYIEVEIGDTGDVDVYWSGEGDLKDGCK